METISIKVISDAFKFLLISCATVFIIWLLQFYWKRRRLYKMARRIPGPYAYPIIGNAYLAFGSSTDQWTRIQNFFEQYKGKTPIRLWGFSVLFIGIAKPDDLQIVLNSPKALQKGNSYKFMEGLFGDGLVKSNVPKWKRHRKIILPTFNQRILDSFVDVFVKQSLILVERLKQEENGTQFNVISYITRCTLDIICETALGVTVNAQTEETEYFNSCQRELEIAHQRILKFWYHPEFIYRFSSLSKEERKCVKVLRDFSNKVVERKSKAFMMRDKECDKKSITILDDGKKTIKNKVFLDHLMELAEESGDSFSLKELREEVDTMIFAGTDTTASINSFTLMMLGIHHDVQEKVYEELCEIFGKTDRLVVTEDLPKMRYLERVIKETMRLFPIAPVLGRHATGDIELTTCVIPAGANISLGVYFMHRDPTFWPDPNRFDPDRFLPEEVAKRHPYSYLPFSAGPRNCIGLRYAMMAMKVLISTILRNYEVFADYKLADVHLKADILLKPVEGYMIRLKPRNK